MFTVNLTFIVIDMLAGTVFLVYYVLKGMDENDQRPYIVTFGVLGLLGVIMGVQLTFTESLPTSFNVVYGEVSGLFGIVFLGTSLAISQGWDLLLVAIYVFFAGVDAMIVGLRLLSLGLARNRWLRKLVSLNRVRAARLAGRFV